MFRSTTAQRCIRARFEFCDFAQEDDEGGLAGLSIISGGAHWSSGRRDLDGAGEPTSDGRARTYSPRSARACPARIWHGMACPAMADDGAAIMSQMVFTSAVGHWDLANSN